jgi:hypothetical protein
MLFRTQEAAMVEPYGTVVGRRRFLKQTLGAGVGVAGSLLAGAGRADAAAAAEDKPNTHNMLVVGEHTVFLSHLPMFQDVNATKTRFTSPHRFQVILEATFTKGAASAQDVYFKDRQDHADVRIYTLNPEPFVLSQVFTPRADGKRLDTFTGTVFRGHLERGGKSIAGLQDAPVTVTRIVHAREFDPAVNKPEELEYILFGSGSELFAAHTIAGPPDFDHVLSIALEGRELTKQELAQDMRITITGRKNAAASRLREGQTVAGLLTIGGRPPSSGSSAVRISAAREFYFEEGELLVPATFDDTEEEKKAVS